MAIVLRRLLLPVIVFLVWVPAAGAWSWPVHGPVLQPFDYDEAHPYAGGQHRGIDIGADASGDPVVAPAAGTVSFAGTVPTSGKSVTIETPDGYSVTLTHLGSIFVAKGAAVAEDDEVGTVGPSGTPELDVPYVHLGIRVTADENGYLDPLAFLPLVALPPAPASAEVAAPAAGDPAATGDSSLPLPVPDPVVSVGSEDVVAQLEDGDPAVPAPEADSDEGQDPAADAPASPDPAAIDPVAEPAPVEAVPPADGSESSPPVDAVPPDNGSPADPTDPAAGDPTAAGGDPVATDPAPGDPVSGDPSAGDPTAGNPAAGDPTTQESDPVAGDPTSGDPVGADPTAGDPTAGDPAAGDPASGDPASGDPVAGDPTTGSPGAGDPVAGDPTSGNPSAGDPTAGDPTAENPTGADPTAGDPSTGDPTAGGPTGGDPAAGDPTAGDPTAGDPTAGDPGAGDPTTGDPTSGQPVSGDPTGDPGSGTSGSPVDSGQGVSTFHHMTRLVTPLSLGEGAAPVGIQPVDGQPVSIPSLAARGAAAEAAPVSVQGGTTRRRVDVTPGRPGGPPVGRPAVGRQTGASVRQPPIARTREQRPPAARPPLERLGDQHTMTTPSRATTRRPVTPAVAAPAATRLGMVRLPSFRFAPVRSLRLRPAATSGLQLALAVGPGIVAATAAIVTALRRLRRRVASTPIVGAIVVHLPRNVAVDEDRKEQRAA